MRPGLTGLWQVTERDGEGRMHLRVATDLEYINTLSFRNDLRILRMTPGVILRGDPEPAVARLGQPNNPLFTE